MIKRNLLRDDVFFRAMLQPLVVRTKLMDRYGRKEFLRNDTQARSVRDRLFNEIQKYTIEDMIKRAEADLKKFYPYEPLTEKEHDGAKLIARYLLDYWKRQAELTRQHWKGFEKVAP